MRLLACLGWLFAVLPVLAGQQPAPGLMWNRSGLPLTFPLHVRTGRGDAYYLRLVDPDTGVPVLAAWFEGGGLFRVLAPPGEWHLVILHGPAGAWEGERSGFGVDTERIGPMAVTFGVIGLGTRQGVIVDLLGDNT